MIESPSLLSFPEGFAMSAKPFASMEPVSVVAFPEASTSMSPSREREESVVFLSSTHSSAPVLGEERSSEMMRAPVGMGVVVGRENAVATVAVSVSAVEETGSGIISDISVGV